jgi:hypothetical protein
MELIPVKSDTNYLYSFPNVEVKKLFDFHSCDTLCDF